jgi:hypothetical protein
VGELSYLCNCWHTKLSCKSQEIAKRHRIKEQEAFQLSRPVFHKGLGTVLGRQMGSSIPGQWEGRLWSPHSHAGPHPKVRGDHTPLQADRRACTLKVASWLAMPAPSRQDDQPGAAPLRPSWASQLARSELGGEQPRPRKGPRTCVCPAGTCLFRGEEMNPRAGAPVAPACNPSYSGNRDQEDRSSKPAGANSSRDPVSKHLNKKQGWRSGSRGRTLA